MIPKPPPRDGTLGFLYIPPFRVQGTSVAGESTCIQVPELDVCFDMGCCPRAMLSSKYVVLSHGHMDHVGGLAYYFSQRQFQGMGPGTVVCSREIAGAVHAMMRGYVDLEQQVTPYTVLELDEGEEIEIKNNIYLRSFRTEHTSPSSGYTIVEKRSKLRPEFYDLPQEKLRELKARGENITRILEVPLVSYTGDTSPGAHLLRDDVRQSQIIIAECTFIDADHKGRATIGKHLHLDDIVEWLGVLECEKLVLVHLSRRSNMMEGRKRLSGLVKRELAEKVEFLMDHRHNRSRYERQLQEAERREAERVGLAT